MRLENIEKILEVAIAKSKYSQSLGCMHGRYTPSELIALYEHGARENNGSSRPTVEYAKTKLASGSGSPIQFFFQATGALKERMGTPKKTDHGRKMK